MDTLCKIRDLQRAIARFEAAFIQRFGLTLNEGMLLCTLLELSCLSASELAEALGLTPSNTSKVIRPVEDKQLIARLISKEDKRHMLFTLTPEGRRLIQEIKESTHEVPEDLLKALSRFPDHDKQRPKPPTQPDAERSAHPCLEPKPGG